MTRLYVVAEGPTEVNFTVEVFREHLRRLNVELLVQDPPNLRGQYTYGRLKKLVKNLLGSTEVVVTTMLDLFKIPSDFPGLTESQEIEHPEERVRRLEQRSLEDVGDHRFFPHLQLHEFEALLLADLGQLVHQYPHRRKEILDLAKRLDHEASPEHVNRRHPPSYRIREAVPEYNKPLAGLKAAISIGLPKLRERCPHFGQWVSRLEHIASQAR